MIFHIPQLTALRDIVQRMCRSIIFQRGVIVLNILDDKENIYFLRYPEFLS